MDDNAKFFATKSARFLGAIVWVVSFAVLSAMWVWVPNAFGFAVSMLVASLVVKVTKLEVIAGI